MKMNPMDFMETLGEVRETYVEEVLDAKEGRGMVRQRQRWSLLPAFGILCGAAVCAVMVFGIWSVKHPEAMRRTPAADSAASSAEQDAMASEAERSSTEIVPTAQTEIITEIGTALKEDGETGTGEKGIIAKIKTGTLTETGCTVILTNLSDENLPYSKGWKLTDAATGTALTLRQPLIIDAKAEALDAGASQELTIDWEPYYGELPNGCYILTFDEENVSDIFVPFTIGGGKTATNTVTAKIKTGTLTETGCTLILTNISDTTLCFGNCWEVADAATGKALTPNQVMEWNDLAWELDSGASQEITINWQPYYSELPNGSYLLRFGDAGIWDISVPFEITGGQTAQTATTTVTAVTAVTGTDTTPVATTTVTTVTAVTSAAAQPKENTENTGSVSVIASFRLDMGYQPARLTEEESANVYALIDALELTPISEYEGSRRASELTGGCYYIETNNETWKLWNEKLIYQNGQWYTDEGDTVKAFLDEVIRLIGIYQP